MEPQHHRVRQVFQYLEALEELRNPVVKELRSQAWFTRFRDIPEHPCIEIGFSDSLSSQDDEEERGPTGYSAAFILRCRRPKIPSPPEPGEVLDGWLEEPLNDPEVEPQKVLWKEVLNDSGENLRVQFDDDSDRSEAWDRLIEKFEEWRKSARPASRAREIFERLYRLYGRLEREGERLELVVADGLLQWRHPQAGIIDHPLLFQRVHLTFDPEIPEFTVVEADHDVEFYTPLLRILPDIDGKTLASLREVVDQEFLHPLEKDRTAKFFRQLVARLSPRGEFLEGPEPRSLAEEPCVCHDPALVLRTRSAGFSQAIESILESIKEGQEEYSSSLIRVVGVDVGKDEGDGGAVDSISSLRSEEDAHDVLYSKAANPEQLQIAKKLEKHDSVIVQGPPGTGKSHTIANLLGHLLAQGKSVLVTSHTTKALRVLRDLVEEPIQGLCVNVLERDVDSRHELQSSIQEIVSRLSIDTKDDLETRAEKLFEKRARIISQLKSLKREAFEARRSEYDEIVIGDHTWLPSEAAQKVAKEQDKNSWIPSPIERGHPLPLSIEELGELYETNDELPEDDEVDLAGELPPTDDLLSPADFDELVAKHESASEKSDDDSFVDYWVSEPSVEMGELLEELAQDFRDAASMYEAQESEWALDAAQAGLEGGAAQCAWEELAGLIEDATQLRAEARGQRFRWDLELQPMASRRKQLEVCRDILNHLEDGQLRTWATWFRPRWRGLIQAVRVDGQRPSRREHFEALSALIEEELAWNKLRDRWQRQMAPLEAPPLENISSSIDEYASTIRRNLDWHSREWSPCLERLSRAGFDYDRFISDQPLPDGHYASLRQRIAIASPGGALQRSLEKRSAKVWKMRSRIVLDSMQEELSPEKAWGGHALTEGLRQAVSQLDCDRYRQVYDRARELRGQRSTLNRRQDLLDRLKEVAPAWSQAIERREGVHGHSDLPGDPVSAWTWIQLKEELYRRARLDGEKLPRKIEKAIQEMRATTSRLVEALAWEAQIRRTSLRQQQALVGWSDTMRKIGKGTGKRAPKLRREARKMMKECRSAVPVWIMPLARAVESFDPKRTRFDVAIIDEASQMDVTGLIVFFMARKVIVVGDHEQVSPLAVGQAVDDVERLITEHLEDIPNAALYDGKTSIYDLARQSFEGLTVLREHFRCVPRIIEFSNGLCYNNKILPLRDTSELSRRPFMVEKKVEGGHAENKVNDREVQFTAALVAATVEQPEYQDATMGVISLVGESQAIQIETLLRKKLEPRVLERHRILCGNAAQFQGDERDVMFLSMVDSPKDGPLRLRERQLFRQRYNVAVSRAKDQLWLVHSLDPATDLKPRDLRRRLIEHIRSTEIPHWKNGLEETESPLEEAVMGFLLSRGYQVRPQVQVGAYRIDMVVEGEGARLAVECDGERYHTIENLRDDMERQAVLERLGWRFVRIRGSQYYQDQDSTMQSVLEELDEMGIKPREEEGGDEGGGGDDYESRGADGDGLKDRVIRRAYELILEWRGKILTDEALRETAAIVNEDGGGADVSGETEGQATTENEEWFLRQPFIPSCSPVVFSPDEWYDLKRYGCYMQALASGKLKARTSSQKRFVAVFREGKEPKSEYEKLWWRYLERRKWEQDPANREAMGPLRTLEDSPVGSREDFERLHSGDKKRIYFSPRRRK